METKIVTPSELVDKYGESPEFVAALEAEARQVNETGELSPATVITPRRGRPKIFDEELDVITWKAPHSQREKMDASARENGETRSEFMRKAVDMLLNHRERDKAA